MSAVEISQMEEMAMKEIDFRWCDVGNATVFQLRVFEKSDNGLLGELHRIENAYMRQCSDIDPISKLKSQFVENIEGNDVEEVVGKATAKVNELGCAKVSWRKERSC